MAENKNNKSNHNNQTKNTSNSDFSNKFKTFFKNARNIKAITIGVLGVVSMFTLANVSITIGENTKNGINQLITSSAKTFSQDSKKLSKLELDVNTVPNYGTNSVMNYSMSTQYRETAVESTNVYIEDGIFYTIDGNIYSDYMSIIGYDDKDNIVKNYKLEKPSIDRNATKDQNSTYTTKYDEYFGKMKFHGFTSGQLYNYIFYVGPKEIMWYFYGDDSNYQTGHVNNPSDKNAYMVIKYDKNYNELERWSAPYAYIGVDSFPDVEGHQYAGNSLGNCPGHTSGQIIESTDGKVITMVSANNGANRAPGQGGKHQTEWIWSLYTDDFSKNNPSYNHSFPYSGFRQNIPGANHSFGQHMYYDEYSNQLTSVSLGDKYPRGVILQAPNSTNGQVKANVLYEIPDPIPAHGGRYQETNTNIGSYVVTKDSYMISLNRSDNFYKYQKGDIDRNLYLYVNAKDGYYCNGTNDKSKSKQIRLTNFKTNEGSASLPYLVRIGENKIVLMWHEFSVKNGAISKMSDLKYCVIDNFGNIKQSVETAKGMSLSAFHEPVYDKETNTIFWFNNIDQNNRHLYRLKVK